MTENGVMPVYNLNERKEDGDGFGNGAWIWVILLFFLFAGGGFGGFGGGAGAAMGAIGNDFLFTNLNSTLDTGFASLNSQNFGMQRDLGQYASQMQLGMCQGFNATQNAIAQASFAAQQCCCETNRNIEAVRAENYRNTCEITTAIHAEGEATRALINANVMQELRDQLQSAQLQLGNLSRTQDLVSQLRPVPIPAYITCSPYGNCACSTTTPTTPAA